MQRLTIKTAKEHIEILDKPTKPPAKTTNTHTPSQNENTNTKK
jgi:hypothetical protein